MYKIILTPKKENSIDNIITAMKQAEELLDNCQEEARQAGYTPIINTIEIFNNNLLGKTKKGFVTMEIYGTKDWSKEPKKEK